MNVYTLQLGDQEVTLRLTTGGLRKYLKEHKVEGCTLLVSLMSATEELDAMADLLTQALQHADNQNAIKRGDDLIDAMIDDGLMMLDIKQILLELFAQSGIVDQEGRDKLADAVQTHARNGVNGVAAMLSGTLSEAMDASSSEDKDPAEDSAENPT